MTDSDVAENRRSEVLPAVASPKAIDSPYPADEFRVQIESLEDIVIARQQARHLASKLGFSKCNLTLIATAISEIARNAVEYANGGEVVITAISSGNRRGVKIVVSDRGPGIADIPSVMRDGYSTVNRLGIGLPGTRRLMDEFEVSSETGEGTTVTMKKWAS